MKRTVLFITIALLILLVACQQKSPAEMPSKGEKVSPVPTEKRAETPPAPTCQAECSPKGARTCLRTTVEAWCSNFDADPCLEWGPPQPCLGRSQCIEGQGCVQQACTDECAGDGTVEIIPGKEGYRKCSNFDADACLEMSPEVLCPLGQYLGKQEQCLPLAPCEGAPRVQILKEDVAGEFSGPDGKFALSKILPKFYAKNEDRYDFIILWPTKDVSDTGPGYMGGGISLLVNHNVVGINTGRGHSSIARRLRSVTVHGAYLTYKTVLEQSGSPPAFDPSGIYGVMHELAHHWCCYIKLDSEGKIVATSEALRASHWPNALDLFTGEDFAGGDIMGGDPWVAKRDTRNCGRTEDESRKQKQFSYLTLYLMGLAPKEKVSPAVFHEFENPADPTCLALPDARYLDSRTITIDDIIALNGERSPSFATSQKQFNVAFVLVVDKDTELPQGFVDDVNQVKDMLPDAWSRATRGTSELAIC